MFHILYLLSKQFFIYHIYFPSNASYTISTYQAVHYLPYVLPKQCFIYHIYFLFHLSYLLPKQCFIYRIYLPNSASYNISTSQAMLHILYLLPKQCFIYRTYFPSNASYTISSLTFRGPCIVIDLLIIREPSNLEIDIFRKPTITDTTINFLSNHPMEHKVATYRHYITRVHSLPLIPKRKQTEWTLI
jgi:hypothetical protein